MGKIITISNQKGGVGKTTTVVTLAGLLASQNQRVLLIDTDPHASLTSYLDYDSDVLDGTLFDLFEQANPDASQVKNVVLKTRFHNISLMPASIALSTLDRTLGDRDGMGLILRRALQHIKEDGRNGWAIYRPEMSTTMPAQPGFLQALSQALERDQFELWYQPTWHAEDKTIHGFEALLRWRHPEQGVLLPGLFLPTLEQTGLIIPVGNWAIEAACRQLHFWTEQGFSQWTLSLNLSPIQFEQPDIFQIVSSMLEKYSLSPSRLILEVTESTALKNLDRSIELLNAFNHAGITVSIDDFGTGYSNLLMLSVLPAKELKIDKSFVTSMLENEKSYKLVETIISIARTMEMNVVAEGIETEEQQAVLTRLGCDYLQGYLFSRPLPAEQVPWLLLQINSDKQIIPINKIQTDPAFISQKNHA